MKNKKIWIIVAAVLLVLAVLIIVMAGRNQAAPGEGEKENTVNTETSAEAESSAETEPTAEGQETAETGTAGDDGEEESVSSVTIPDGMEVGGEGLD